MTPRNDAADRRDPNGHWPVERLHARETDETPPNGKREQLVDPVSIRIVAGQVALLDALLGSADGKATIDDATGPIEREFCFPDGGQWRGQIVSGLAARRLIRKVGYVASTRPSRHGSPVAEWELCNRAAAVAARKRLIAVLDHLLHETPPAATDGVSDGSNPNKEDSTRG